MLKRRLESRYTGFVPGRWALRVLCIGGAALFQTSLALGQTSSSNLASTEVKLVSTEFKYEPAMLHVAAGRSVAVVLDNTQAETDHGIFIPALGMRIDAKAGTMVKRDFVFDRPGEYEFSCNLPGHSDAGMKGKFIFTTQSLDPATLNQGTQTVSPTPAPATFTPGHATTLQSVDGRIAVQVPANTEPLAPVDPHLPSLTVHLGSAARLRSADGHLTVTLPADAAANHLNLRHTPWPSRAAAPSGAGFQHV